MDRQHYFDESIWQLSNTNFYEELPQDLSDEVIHRISLQVYEETEEVR